MMKNLLIVINEMQFEAALNESSTAELIYKALPFEGRANTWGDEIYLSVPVDADLEPDAHEEVEVGELAFWPPGSAFCIFFGQTPASTNEKPRAASPVNVFGKIQGNLEGLKKVRSGSLVQVREK
jgi:hypothetical protein